MDTNNKSSEITKEQLARALISVHDLNKRESGMLNNILSSVKEHPIMSMALVLGATLALKAIFGDDERQHRFVIKQRIAGK